MDNRILKWLILVALALLIIAFLIFWFGGPSFSESGVHLSIEGLGQASVGDEITYKVKYSNSTKIDLSKLKFSFYYPEESVVMKNGSPISNLSEDFTIDKLSQGQSGEKEFKVFLVGNRGDIKTAKIKLLYRASGLTSEFEKTTSFPTTITSLPVSLTLVAPPNTISGQTVNYILDYRNESGNDISDLRFEFTYPDGLSIQNVQPANSGASNVWNVPLMKKGQGSRISIQGILTGREGESKTISVLLKKKAGSSYINYEKATSSSVISNPILNLDIIANNSKTYSAILGEGISYRVLYTNNSNFNLIGLNLVVKLEGDMYDFNTVSANDGFYDASAKTIQWNSSTISDFANLPPNKKGEVAFSVKIKNSYPQTSGTKNTFIKASARLSTPNTPEGVDGDEVATDASLITKISTQPVFAQSVYYNDPSYGSSGPFPPKVGQETTFTVHWQLSNPGSDVSDAKVVATLPLGVTWKNIISVGANQPEPTFNSNTSQITWDLKTLSQGVGIYLAKYETSFQISIKPVINQKGSPVTLLKNIKFTGKDTNTAQLLVISASDVDTNKLVDKQDQGNVE